MCDNRFCFEAKTKSGDTFGIEAVLTTNRPLPSVDITDVDVPAALDLFGLTDLIETPETVRAITPEEYDALYGEEDDGDAE